MRCNRLYRSPSGGGGKVLTQLDVADASSGFLDLYDITLVRETQIEYAIEQDVTGFVQEGEIEIIHNGTNAFVIESTIEYPESQGEIDGVTFTASIVVGKVRLTVANASGNDIKLTAQQYDIQIAT